MPGVDLVHLHEQRRRVLHEQFEFDRLVGRQLGLVREREVDVDAILQLP